MSNSSTGQVLGAATVAGGISVLADTVGNPMMHVLSNMIKLSFIAVIASFVIIKIIRHVKTATK